MARQAPIQIEGYEEFRRDLRRQAGAPMAKKLGQAHKEVGKFLISRIPDGPATAVGAGAGASIRPSATAKEVILRVGGTHRDTRAQQWGKRQVGPFEAGARPHIIGTVRDNEEAIRQELLRRTVEALGPAFAEAE